MRASFRRLPASSRPLPASQCRLLIASAHARASSVLQLQPRPDPSLSLGLLVPAFAILPGADTLSCEAA